LHLLLNLFQLLDEALYRPVNIFVWLLKACEGLSIQTSNIASVIDSFLDILDSSFKSGVILVKPSISFMLYFTDLMLLFLLLIQLIHLFLSDLNKLFKVINIFISDHIVSLSLLVVFISKS